MRRNKPMRGVAATITLVMAMVAPALSAQETEIVLPVVINAVPVGESNVLIAGDDIYLPIATLERGRVTGVPWERVLTVARLRNVERPIGGEPAVSLRSLAPWTTFQFDEAELTLTITIDPNFLGTSAVTVEDARPPDIKYSADNSTFVNYAVTSTSFSDVSAFAEIGSSIRGNLLYTSMSSVPGSGLTRGITNYTIDQRESLRRFTFGDAPVVTDELGGAGIIGGVTAARNFDLDPYFIRFPSLSLRGTALTPSQVEVYVNGVLVDRQTVPPGPFEVANVPAASGTSAATVVVRDAFGREQSHSTSFYYSTAVLEKGLSEFTYSAGMIRDSLSSFDYEEPVALATHRYGLSENLTVGGRLEATGSLVSGGPSIAFASRFGELDLKLAASSVSGHSGVAGQFGFRRLSRRANVAGTIRVRSRDYVNFSLPVERDRALQEAVLFASYLPRWGNIGLQWTGARMRDTEDRQRVALLTNIGLASRANLLLSAAAVEEGDRRFGEYFVGISFRPFGDSTMNVSSHSRDGVNTVTTELQRPLPVGTGWGYRVQSATGPDDTISTASVQYQNDFGRYEIGVDPQNPDDAFLSAAGALVYQAGNFTPTRPVSQSFALVRVPGVEGVRIYLSNQLVGRTDSRGELLVPNLLPYYGNRIAIDDRDVPMTYDIQVVEQTIAPPPRGGALVVFPARVVRAASGAAVVRTAEAEVIPAYGEIRILRDGVEDVSPLGGQGEFYFENVSAGSYDATVIYAGGTCSFVLQIPEVGDELIDLGRVACGGAAP